LRSGAPAGRDPGSGAAFFACLGGLGGRTVTGFEAGGGWAWQG